MFRSNDSGQVSVQDHCHSFMVKASRWPQVTTSIVETSVLSKYTMLKVGQGSLSDSGQVKHDGEGREQDQNMPGSVYLICMPLETLPILIQQLAIHNRSRPSIFSNLNTKPWTQDRDIYSYFPHNILCVQEEATFLYSNLLYKMDHYFLDTQYIPAEKDI